MNGLNGGHGARDIEEQQRRGSGTSSQNDDVIHAWDGPGFRDGELSVTAQKYPIREGKGRKKSIKKIYSSLLLGLRDAHGTFLQSTSWDIGQPPVRKGPFRDELEGSGGSIDVYSRCYCQSNDRNGYLQRTVDSHEGDR
jgi:hypothetical protein